MQKSGVRNNAMNSWANSQVDGINKPIGEHNVHGY